MIKAFFDGQSLYILGKSLLVWTYVVDEKQGNKLISQQYLPLVLFCPGHIYFFSLEPQETE